jgi:hypothetical protein
MEVFEEATKEDYGFLTIDFNRKKEHPSMFRKCWNEWILQLTPCGAFPNGNDKIYSQ